MLSTISCTLRGAGIGYRQRMGAAALRTNRITTRQIASTDEAEMKRADIVFEDGTRLSGWSFGSHTSAAGEMVFSTGMVGYTESLTDPSYRGQFLSMTYPMIGNYGVPDKTVMDEYGLAKGFESHKIQAAGIICQEYSRSFSHWNAHMSLGDYLKSEGVPGLTGFDTRLLTKKIRDHGALKVRVEIEGSSLEPGFNDPNVRNLVSEVSRKDVLTFGQGNGTRVLAVDCGIKSSIIRFLAKRGCEVTVVPWNYPIHKEYMNYDGLFFSNGPGDPKFCKETIANLKEILDSGKIIPTFGICLGNQLLGLAAGGDTHKLAFGNRGLNQPVKNTLTGQSYITSQNHGFALDKQSLPKDFQELFYNLNDGSNEGIAHLRKPIFSAQFHPEANAGPLDTEGMFNVFIDNIKMKTQGPIVFPPSLPILPRKDFKKVLVLGSGGLSIGQAGEFDYSGSQAIKALKEEGIRVVLINPNIASVQTNVDAKSTTKADEVFFLPVQPEYVTKIIEREKPDGIVISMGGQTALNCAVEMYKAGTFDKHNVEVLGTPIDNVINTEDRDIFAHKCREIGERLAESEAVTTAAAAQKVAERIGFPVMIRSAFALGGLGSGICESPEQLNEFANRALSTSPQILVEQSLKGWKEVEYEVVRDTADNCITVCNMENFDPLGVHTGDSIVVAPSQTLSNEEYHMLRTTAIKVVRHLGIVGECNIQYALDPKSLDYCIIEVNARLSRSSALASKATGYPLAFVAAKLGLGITLPEIQNSVTKKTQACFEPSLDYCVTKVPRWDLAKFSNVSTEIGSSMKSVGEVMAIGRTWEESVQKALRMVDPAIPGFEPRMVMSKERIQKELVHPSDMRVYAIAQCFYNNEMSPEEVHDVTSIDLWFLHRLKRIADERRHIQVLTLDAMARDDMRRIKQRGFSDSQIALALKGHHVTTEQVRDLRKTLGVTPSVKQIDTLAAEFPAATNYLYTTYFGDEHDISLGQGGKMVLGCGAYRIGSSVEFDWCAVSSMRALRQQGHRGIMVNYNPETVSTDYDECDQLYFEELSYERVRDIYELEHANGVIISVGGQIPNNLAVDLQRGGLEILGTSADSIDNAEDRDRFSSLVDRLGLEQAPWKAAVSHADAVGFSNDVGFPVLVRPSYVLSGAAMNVAYDLESLLQYLDAAGHVSGDHPVVISKFVENGREIEMDAVACKGDVVAAAMHEHIENAGVHSGDATLMLPVQNVSSFTQSRVQDATRKIAKALDITGPFNIQFIAKGSSCLVIECNLRASRSFPFVSKSHNVDFIEAATKVMLGSPVDDMNLPQLGHGNTLGPRKDFVAVKAPMFSFTRLRGADPVLGVEMASTGEVACFGENLHEAFLKALMSTGFNIPKKAVLVSGDPTTHEEMIHSVWLMHHELNYDLYSTSDTHAFLASHGIRTKALDFNTQEDLPKVVEFLQNKNVDLVVNLTSSTDTTNHAKNYILRRSAVDFGIPLFTNTALFKLLSAALTDHHQGKLVMTQVDSLFDHYMKETEEHVWSNYNEFH